MPEGKWEAGGHSRSFGQWRFKSSFKLLVNAPNHAIDLEMIARCVYWVNPEQIQQLLPMVIVLGTP